MSAAELAWSKHKLLNESIIVALFQGQFKSTVQCMSCQHKSRTFETFMYLTLEMTASSKCSLQVKHTHTPMTHVRPVKYRYFHMYRYWNI